MTSAIVVLGKGINEDGTITREAERSVKRAAELFKTSKFDMVVMSGRWSYTMDYTPSKTEAEAMKEYAVKLGIPAESILLEEESLDTLGNAYYTKRLLDDVGGVTSITVVTVDFHRDRSKYIFEKIFGPKIKLDFATSSTEYIDADTARQHQEYNARALATIKRLLDGVPSGDGERMRKVFETIHPLYAKDPRTVPEEIWKFFERTGRTREWIIQRYSKKKSKRT